MKKQQKIFEQNFFFFFANMIKWLNDIYINK
jgi:hypothetical protein